MTVSCVSHVKVLCCVEAATQTSFNKQHKTIHHKKLFARLKRVIFQVKRLFFKTLKTCSGNEKLRLDILRGKK